MIDIKQIKKVVLQFELFFKGIKENSQNEGDIERAIYGLSKVKFLQNIVKKYEKKMQNKLLKQIDVAFVSIIRGVEFFEDYESNKKFYELSNYIPDLKPHIKW